MARSSTEESKLVYRGVGGLGLGMAMGMGVMG